MDLQGFKSSIVVVAQNHNPTLLHPYFLKDKEIVNPDWELAEQPICIPPLAKVVYNSGITITVKEQQLQVDYVGDDIRSGVRTAAETTQKYITELPHVRYTAVGINFYAFCPVDNPQIFLIDRFLQQGSWNTEELPLSGTKLQFSYLFSDYRLTLSVDLGEKNNVEQGATELGLMLTANYHADCTLAESALSDIQSALDSAESRYSDFIAVVNNILE